MVAEKRPRPRRSGIEAEEERAWVEFYQRVRSDAVLAAEVLAQLDKDAEMKRSHLALYLSCKESLRREKAREARNKRIGYFVRQLAYLPVAFWHGLRAIGGSSRDIAIEMLPEPSSPARPAPRALSGAAATGASSPGEISPPPRSRKGRPPPPPPQPQGAARCPCTRSGRRGESRSGFLLSSDEPTRPGVFGHRSVWPRTAALRHPFEFPAPARRRGRFPLTAVHFTGGATSLFSHSKGSNYHEHRFRHPAFDRTPCRTPHRAGTAPDDGADHENAHQPRPRGQKLRGRPAAETRPPARRSGRASGRRI